MFCFTLEFMQIGNKVEAKHPDQNQWMDSTIAKLTDCSTYTVGKWITASGYSMH